MQFHHKYIYLLVYKSVYKHECSRRSVSLKVLRHSATDDGGIGMGTPHKLLEAVLQRRPHLAAVLEEYGEMTLGRYVETFFTYRQHPIYPERLAVFTSLIHKHAGKLLGEEIAQQTAERIKRVPVVLTSDHHGILAHPILVNGNILFALSGLLGEEETIIPIFGDGNVPLDNATYPRGIFLTEESERGHVPLFSGKKHQHTRVCVAPPFDVERVQNAVRQVDGLRSQKILSKHKAQAIKGFIAEIVGSTKVLEQETFCDQITLINYALVPRFFKDNHHARPVSIHDGDIVSQWLCSALDNEPENPVSRLIMDEMWRKKANEIFRAIPGAWGAAGGTFLFWGIYNGKTVPLHEENGCLVGSDISCELKQDSLIHAIEKKVIIPGLLLCFIIEAFYFGLKCYGGFMQVDYLTRMKQSWIKLLEYFGESAEAKAVCTVPTANYSTGPTLFFIEREGLKSAGGMDLLARPIAHEQLLSVAHHTVKEVNLPGMSMVYRIIYRADADPALAAITAHDILQQTGMDDLVLFRQPAVTR